MFPSHLADHPLPSIEDGTDKNSRGSVLVVAGSAPVPGAALLTATAVLRVGAGKVQVATASEHRSALGIAIPEALVMPFADLDVGKNDAVVVGPGLLGDDAELVRRVCAQATDDTTVIVDAGSLIHLPDELPRRTILIPNEDEAEDLGNGDAKELARRYGAVVAVRGAETWMATPDGEVHCDDAGTPGLAVSGSGDVLAGMVGGLAARGADPYTAVLWAVHLHGVAGERLGPPGFLARELLDVVPAVLHDLPRQ